MPTNLFMSAATLPFIAESEEFLSVSSSFLVTRLFFFPFFLFSLLTLELHEISQVIMTIEKQLITGEQKITLSLFLDFLSTQTFSLSGTSRSDHYRAADRADTLIPI